MIKRVLSIRVVFMAMVLTACSSFAQQVLAPPPVDFSGLSPSRITTGTNQPGAVPPIIGAAPTDDAPFKLGPFRFRPHLLYRFLYGDGVPAAPGFTTKTTINEFYPGMLITIGNHWNLDYTPSLRYYSSRRFQDTLDHSVILTGGTIYEEWTLGFSQSYSSSSQPLIETGAQTDQENFNTALNAAYQISTQWSLELGANQAFRFVGDNQLNQQLTDSKNWSTMDWLNYQISPKIGTAIGLGFGYDNITAGSDMTSEQLQGRITWRPGQKLFVSLSGGLEDRQFLDSDQSDAINPIFGLSAQYHLFEPTTLSIGASRMISASYFANQITETTTVSAGLHQRLVEHLFLDLTGGYTKTKYSASTTFFSVNRDDDSTFFNARLSLQVLQRGNVAVFFQNTENTSSESAFTLSSSQVGFEVGYRF